MTDDYLRLALHTGSPDAAAVYAEKGLRYASDRVDAETRVLLLREIYRSHLYAVGALGPCRRPQDGPPGGRPGDRPAC